MITSIMEPRPLRRAPIRETQNLVLSLVFAIVSCVSALGTAGAQEVDDSKFGSEFLLGCVAHADRLFERTQSSNVDPKTRAPTITSIAQEELACAPVAIRVCLNAARTAECLASLGGTLKNERLALLADLPNAITAKSPFVKRLYENTLASAAAVEPFDNCPAELVQHTKGCEVMAKASAFQIARQAYWISTMNGQEIE